MSSKLRSIENVIMSYLEALYNRESMGWLRTIYRRGKIFPWLMTMAIGLRSWLQQFTPFSSERKNTDSCVIGQGIGKSGTYLVNSILVYLGKWENLRVHLLNRGYYYTSLHGDFSHNYCFPQFFMKRLRNGQMVAGHLCWTKGLEKSMAQVTPNRRIKHVFIYRDPRDSFVSNLNFVTYSKGFGRDRGTRSMQRYMLENFSNDDERLTYIIKNDHLTPTYALRFEPWLRSPHCLAIKFEDLYPDIVNLSNGVVGEVLRRLLEYLEVDVNSIDPLDFYSKVYGKSITATSLVHKVGQYKRLFKDHHYALIDNPEFRSMLNAFGYEW